MLSVNVFISNAMTMIKNWSKDRCPVEPKPTNPFSESIRITDDTWKLVWVYVHKTEPVVQQIISTIASDHLLRDKKRA
jgi:hypothetical protein